MDQAQLWEKLGAIAGDIKILASSVSEMKAEQKTIYTEIESLKTQMQESRTLQKEDYQTIESKIHGHISRIQERVDDNQLNYKQDKREIEQQLKAIEKWQTDHDNRLKSESEREEKARLNSPLRKARDGAITALASAGAVGAVIYIAQLITNGG